MSLGNFKSFLAQLGFSDLLLKEVTDSFPYSIDSPSISHRQITIPYFYFNTKEEVFKKHLDLWNRNAFPSFIAVFDNKTYIIDSRQIPDDTTYLPQRIIIGTFDYGVNSEEYDIKGQLRLISKEGIDTSLYFDFIIEKQKNKKTYEVDKELLLDLLELRQDLSSKPNELVDLLLLRCLFVKYLEDRGVFLQGTLLKTLNSESPEQLIRTFSKIRKINGDLFSRKELSANDIPLKYLKKLSDFFGYVNYRKGQLKFFPYQFDKIPIQLISHIYESFLGEKTKKGSGVYYTPAFLVDFMLSQTLQPRLKENPKITFLDPACGSAAFMVSAFRMMIKANSAEKDYEKKKEILQKQIFGVDLDERALIIAAFSLYLALLEGEDQKFIQEKIDNEAPILPGLIGNNLICSNALTQDIIFNLPKNNTIKTFDCIAANPPWGSVPDDNDEENIKTREFISEDETYKNVSDFQRSQMFLLRTKHWSHKSTVISMVVNNSIFFNENSIEFRKYFLDNYRLGTFYELSDINPILFKKRTIGKIKGKNIEIGANEPCCILIYDTDKEVSDKLHYITPRLNRFSKNLRLVSYSQKDIVEVNQTDLQQEDLLWKIFVDGNWSEYQIIKKRILQKDTSLTVKCDVGFKPQMNMKRLGKSWWRTLIEPTDFTRYCIINKKLKKFNWNQNLERKRVDETIYTDPKILIPVRPLTSDELRFRGVFVNQDFVFKDNTECIRFYKNKQLVKDFRSYLAIINSKFVGFYFYNISSQWGKGNKRVRLNTVPIENIPFPLIDSSDTKIKQLVKLVDSIIKEKSAGKEVKEIEENIDSLVFDLYNLTEYERTVVNEFYEIFYRQKSRRDRVNENDLNSYANRFRNVFRLMLSEEFDLTFIKRISSNLGAVVCFTIQNKKNPSASDQSALPEILQIVKTHQTEKAFVSSVLAEEKVKYYDKEHQQFYIIKSNQYRDWTERQAIDDANEEIGDIIKYLKEK